MKEMNTEPSMNPERLRETKRALICPTRLAIAGLHKGSWAEGFAAKVLPVLLEEEVAFCSLYCADNGRPNWSVARMLGLSLLQEFYDLDDQKALDCLSFDIRWQHALGITPEDAYLSRRSLVDFRSRLVSIDPEMTMCVVFSTRWEKRPSQIWGFQLKSSGSIRL
jgi:hypothetical protein